jgi:uncharacterized Fe-S cluster protein YjdI
MDAELREHAAFYLTGRRSDADHDPVEELGMRPALLAGYRDLTTLRYDFPIVLLKDSPDGSIAEPLSGLIDRALAEAAVSGHDGERLRIHALRLERELRSMAARGVSGSLLALLDLAARHLAPGTDASLLADSVRRLQEALRDEGELIDCDAALPSRLLTHAWQAVQRKKAAAFRKNIDRLILKLNEILRADLARSSAARMPASLKASVGAVYENAFDFDQLSRCLQSVSGEGSSSEPRRQRIESTLQVLGSQRFYAAPDGAVEPFRFEFDSCARAAAAFRMRLPAMAGLMRAITAAELEIEGELTEPRHQALLSQLGDHHLDARELALFPHYLVCISERDLQGLEDDELMEMLSHGMPVKVLVRTDDLLPERLGSTGHMAFGARGRQIANMAIGLNDVFVLQSASSNLVRCRDRILKAMNYAGPALISVFSGTSGQAGELPPYLTAAAAMESRAFPAFSYDPSAGRDWASRFALDDNPQAERDWPIHQLAYEDAEHQRITEEVAFTLIDFVACDRRYAGHFAPIAPANGNAALAAVASCLDREARSLPGQFPSLLMVDRDNTLRRVIVDESLIREARRCREAWRSLQQLGRIGEASATAADTRAPQETAQALPPAVAPATASVTLPSAAPEKERASGEPYIETVRCSSCNECIQLNSKMFAYDANQQAYIVDPDAGTYRQLVEAAESCQVAVIHPGKPRNPAESDLEELLKRAERFL